MGLTKAQETKLVKKLTGKDKGKTQLNAGQARRVIRSLYSIAVDEKVEAGTAMRVSDIFITIDDAAEKEAAKILRKKN